jgi:hypothetical protein
MAIWQNQSIQLVNETNSMYQQIDSDVLQGVIRIPMRTQLLFEWALRGPF